MDTSDRVFMMRALELASHGEGLVSPNPMVGAVIVKDSLVIGEGYHLYENLKHAESYALDEAGAAASGATLYCSLEPCCHEGRTPPCTDAIIDGGLARVVIAVADPDVRVNGKGIALLAAAGLKVDVGLCADEATRLNECYMKHIRTGSPFLHLILPPPEDETWIPSPDLLKTLRRYDALVLMVSSAAAGMMEQSVVSHHKHRPVVVVLQEDRVQSARPESNALNVDLIPLAKEETALADLVARLKASSITSAAIFGGAIPHDHLAKAIESADKVTVIRHPRDDRLISSAETLQLREATLNDSKTVAANGRLEITGYLKAL